MPLGEVLLADGDYGRLAELRGWATDRRLPYAVGVHATQHVWDAAGAWSASLPVAAFADVLSARPYRRLAWRTDADGGTLSARFAFLRVRVARADGTVPTGRGAAQWLVIEWRDGEAQPSRFYLSTLPRRLRMRELVRLLKERWRIERFHEDLKGEVGFDHFEGRSWRGWNHHVTIALCAHASLTAKRCVGFPPVRPAVRACERTSARPERHIPDSLPSLRLLLARRAIARFWSRCPCCLRDFEAARGIAATPTRHARP